MKPPLSYCPLLPVAAALCAGIIIGRYCGASALTVSVIGAVVVAALLSRSSISIVIVVSFAAGWGSLLLHRPATIDVKVLDRAVCSGVVTDVRAYDDIQSLTVEVDTVAGRPVTMFRTIVSVPTSTLAVRNGDCVTFRGRWHEVALLVDLPDEDDMSDYCYANAIAGRCFIHSDDIVVTGHRDGLIWYIKDMRERVSDIIFDSGLNARTALFVNAVITGDTSLVSAEDRELFSGAGVAHVLALSGMHVALIAMFAAVALWPVEVAGHRRLRLVLVVVLLWLYAVMTGMGESVVRATLMATVVAGARIMQRRHSSLNALCFAAIVLLVFNPLSLFKPGFQLSFAAVAAIILLARPLNPFRRSDSRLRWIGELITVPLAAVIGTGLLSVYYFHNFAPLFLLTNVPATFILPVIFVSGLLIVLSGATGLPGGLFCRAAETFYDLLDGLMRWTGSFDSLNVIDVYLDTMMLVPLYLVVVTGACALIFRRRVWVGALAASCIFAVVMIVSFEPEFAQSEAFITRRYDRTDIIVREGEKYYIFTTDDHPDIDDVERQCARRYRHYIARRRLVSGGILADTVMHGTFAVRKPMFYLGRKRYRWVDFAKTPGDTLDGEHADYLLVGRKFKGDVVELSRLGRADTLVLLREMHPRRVRRYAAELSAAGCPYIQL